MAAVLGPGQWIGHNVHLANLNHLRHDHRAHDDEHKADLDADAGALLPPRVPIADLRRLHRGRGWGRRKSDSGWETEVEWKMVGTAAQ